MPIAVEIEIAAAAEGKPGFGIAFGIEFYQLQAIHGDVSKKRDVMLFGHRMRYRCTVNKYGEKVHPFCRYYLAEEAT